MDEHSIRQRAYEIWEREGRPEGRHDAHWEQARRELESSAGESLSDGGNLNRAAAEMISIEGTSRTTETTGDA